MFVNEDYQNFKYVVSVSDNYVCLTNRSFVNADWQNSQTIDVIYQYLKPSFLVIEGERTFTNSQNFEQISVTSDDFYRADYCDYFNSAMLFIGVIVFTILTALTRIVKKGGMINGQ